MDSTEHVVSFILTGDLLISCEFAILVYCQSNGKFLCDLICV